MVYGMIYAPRPGYRAQTGHVPSVLRRLSSIRLGETVDPNVMLAQFYYGLILPILNSKCTAESNVVKCAQFQTRLAQCQQQLDLGVAQLAANDPTALITLTAAVWCSKELYEDVQKELEPEAPPPPPPPAPLPPKPETSIPWWAWALGALGLVGAGVGVVMAVRK